MCQDCDLLIRRFPVGGISFSSPARRRTRKKACDAPRPEVPGCPRCAARAVRFSQEHLQAQELVSKRRNRPAPGAPELGARELRRTCEDLLLLDVLEPFHRHGQLGAAGEGELLTLEL